MVLIGHGKKIAHPCDKGLGIRFEACSGHGIRSDGRCNLTQPDHHNQRYP